tara:strand:- start:2797 stop:3165 length:369 start_codon:yes stop_codon:yes gene_type:complete
MSTINVYRKELLETAKMISEDASERLGSEIVVLDITKISDFSDYFVFITGETERHLETIANSISRMTKGKSLRVNHREGKGENGWILLDYNGLVVNIMTRDVREFYDLESLWSKGTEVLRMQ